MIEGSAAEAAAAAAAGGAAVVSPLAGKHPATNQFCLAPCVDGRITCLNPADDSMMR
jgi:hypothetical protein